MSGFPNPVWNRHERRLRAGWRLLLHLVVTGLVLYAYFTLADALRTFRWARSNELLVAIVTQGLGLICAGLLCFRYVDRRPWSQLQFTRRTLVSFLWGGALGGVLMMWILAIGLAGGWFQIDRWPDFNAIGIRAVIYSQLVWLVMMIVVAISEEFFSRGLQMKNLAEGLRPLGTICSACLAIGISSAFFGFLHAANPNATWGSTINITVAGTLLGISRMTGGNLALPIGLHTTWNFFQGPVFGFEVSGNRTPGTLMDATSTGPEWITGGEFGPEAGLLGLLATLIGVSLLSFWRWALGSPSPQHSLLFDAWRLVRFRTPSVRKHHLNMPQNSEVAHSQHSQPEA